MAQENLRAIVRGAYDVQKLRIQMGNRIVGNFKAKLGQKPSTSEEELDDDAKDILATIRAAYKKFTDAVSTDAKTRFPKRKDFEGDEVISDYTELCLVAQYLDLEKHETEHFRRLLSILKGYRIFTEFLEGVKGVGPAMAGVLLSEIDISKARYPSSLWAYAGLDVVGWWALDGVSIVTGEEEAMNAWAGEHLPKTRPLDPRNVQGSVSWDADGDQPVLTVAHAQPKFSMVAVYAWKGDGGGRSRRKEHLRETIYKAKDGTEKTKMGITFNPWLKTKLYVLAGSFLKAGAKDNPYREVYDDYKGRLEQHATYGIHNDGEKDPETDRLITSKGRRHGMSMRYMTKMFLIDLYKVWREIEGLPVELPYHEAKLGLKHAG